MCSAYNILNETAGPKSFIKICVSEDIVSTTLKLFKDDHILLHTKKCTQLEVHCQLGNKDEDAFISILSLRGAIKAKVLDL